MVRESILNLLQYIEQEQYKGYDPYDALTSPLLNRALLKKNRTLSFGIQQLVKRSPINFRPFLFIQKGYNPVTLGLCLQSYANLIRVFPDKKAEYEIRIENLILELKRLIPKGYHGACWGYDFPWQARYAKIDSLQPTIVATGIVTNGLYQCYKETGIREAFSLCQSGIDFALKDLKRTYDGSSFCFSYSPFDNQQVYNASAKGIRLLSQVYAETREEQYKDIAELAAKYIINRQKQNGSWYYSETGKWIDNYHTGYILDCLHEYYSIMKNELVRDPIKNGFEFYRNNFFTSKGIPKLKTKKLFPVDSTAAGQSLLTLSRFNDIELAELVAEWIINNMQSPKGYFYYRKSRYFTNKISFMRWSNAWILAGLSSLETASITKSNLKNEITD